MHFVVSSKRCAFLRALDALLRRFVLIVIGDQPRLDRPVAGEERLHVHDEVPDHRHAADRLDDDLGWKVFDEDLAGEAVHAVDDDRVRAADPVPARAPDSEGSVLVPLDLMEEVEETVHRVGVDPVLLEVALGVGLRVEPEDLEGDFRH